MFGGIRLGGGGEILIADENGTNKQKHILNIIVHEFIYDFFFLHI